jgi:hypothetical protein
VHVAATATFEAGREGDDLLACSDRPFGSAVDLEMASITSCYRSRDGQQRVRRRYAPLERGRGDRFSQYVGGVRRAVASVCLLVGLVTSLSGCGLDRRQEVRVGIEQLTSIAAEGALMADDVARERTTTTLVRVHGDELSAQAQHEAEKLNDDSIPRDLTMRAQTAIKLASDIGGAIDDLRTSPHDRQRARQDEAKLRRWSAEAYRLGNSI